MPNFMLIAENQLNRTLQGFDRHAYNTLALPYECVIVKITFGSNLKFDFNYRISPLGFPILDIERWARS